MAYRDKQGVLRDMFGKPISQPKQQSYKWEIRGAMLALFILWLGKRSMTFWFWWIVIVYMLGRTIKSTF